MRTRTFTALCLTVTAAVGLTACGGGTEAAPQAPAKKAKQPLADLSGPEIAVKSLKATRTASSLTLKGTAPDGDGGQVSIDLSLDRKGQCVGTLGMKGSGTFDVVKTGGTLYMRPDEKFVREQIAPGSKAESDAGVEMLAGRWMKSAADSADAKDMAQLCDLDKVLDEFKTEDSMARKGRRTTVNGAPALTLRETDGKEDHTVYVAARGKPYLLKLVSKSADEPGSLTFTDYDKPVRAEVPADKDVVDLDHLKGRGVEAA